MSGRLNAIESSLQQLLEATSSFHSRLQSLRDAASRIKALAATKSTGHKIDSPVARVQDFEEQQQKRLHRMECLSFASDFAHLQKIDCIVAARRNASSCQGMPFPVQHRPETWQCKSSEVGMPVVPAFPCRNSGMAFRSKGQDSILAA